MTNLNTKAKGEPKSRAGWWAAVVGVFGVFSPILPVFLNIAQANVATDIADTLLGNPFEWIMNLLRYISGFLAYLSGQILDLSIEYFVLNMANLVKNIPAIDGLWQTFRDLGNIAFIGILLYIAILTVLNMGNKYNTKRMLVSLVIVALFVNFSLFATKVVIDTSNVVALQFYNAVQVEDCGLDTGCNLSHFFADALNLSSVYDDGSALEDSEVRNWELGLVMMFGAIFNLVAAFAMGAMALLLIIRFVVLVLLMIASPLAFIAFALPGADNWGKQWVDKLLSQSFFAPAMLAMVYLTARMAVELQSGIAGGTNLTDIVLEGEGGEKFGAMIVFIIIIGLMLGSVIVAKKIGAHGASKTIEWGQKARNWGQATVAGAAGAATRSTVGWAGEKADSKFKKTRIAQTYLGNQLRDSTTKRVAEAKFGTKKSFAQVAKGKKEADARLASYDERQKVTDEIKQAGDDTTKRRSLNKLSSKEKIDLGKKFLKDNAELLSENDFKEINNSDKFSEREKQEIKDAAIDTLNALRDQTRQNPTTGNIKSFLSTRSHEQLKDIDIELINQPEIIQNMSSDQFEAALKGRANFEQLSMKRNRLEELNRAINNGSVQSYFAGMKDEEIAKILKIATDSTIQDINSDPRLNPVRMDLRTNDQIIDELGISIAVKLAEEGLKHGEKNKLKTAAQNRSQQQGGNTTESNRNFVDWFENGQGKAIYS